mmetsp:Transcript_38972/g.93784  ORF Transcript_38972/g.93784 Transcript_38972/m.93784 type:complete len:201 (+) Transcript_38972:25-627(+)
MAPDSSNRSGSKSDDSLASLFKSMGGGGDDCDRPACDDTKSALSAALQRVQGVRSVGGKGKEEEDAQQSSTRETATPRGKTRDGRVACPPTRDEIGASTWSLLHSMAAWYPNQPNSEDKRSMSNFMVALARFYPCTWCAADFQRNVDSSPPKTETRDDLCLWLCEQHNIVNDKLGKPRFRCTMDKLDERWRKSSNPDCHK